jgi:hypothetical protein
MNPILISYNSTFFLGASSVAMKHFGKICQTFETAKLKKKERKETPCCH